MRATNWKCSARWCALIMPPDMRVHDAASRLHQSRSVTVDNAHRSATQSRRPQGYCRSSATEGILRALELKPNDDPKQGTAYM